MKVVVYFRRAGNAVPETQPRHNFVTHWIEDENEVPTASFSQVEATALQEMDAELEIQFNSVNAWLKENQAIVIADFTEIENGGKSRPAYGEAYKAASKEGAELVITTTKSIAGQRFSPTSKDLVNIICLEDAETIEQRRWSGSREIVVYLRTPTNDDAASDLLESQKRALAKMVHSGIHTLLAEYHEREDHSAHQPDRPLLRQALSLCRERKARLFIGTTDAFGIAGDFQPDFTDVPYEVAYRRAYDWPETITLDAPPFAIALFFGPQWVRGNIPLYVTNATGSRLHDITVSSFGSAAFDGEHVGTTPSVKKLGTIETGKGRLLEAYDVQFDGDFLTSYTVTATTDDGLQYSGVAHIKEPPPKKWARIEHWRPVGA